ncbi:unnamed protein product, partial [Musa acuminata var. zebrina]
EHERVENVKLWGLVRGGWRAEGVNPKPLDSRLGSRIPSAQFATYRIRIDRSTPQLEVCSERSTSCKLFPASRFIS